MTSPQQIEILDLRHFNARQLRPLIEQEAHLWQQRLHWDYRSSAELLLQYLDSRILPGFVALACGKICGYTFCVYEGTKAVVGDLYVDTSHPTPLAVTHTLCRHLLETLEATPGIDRIEAQLLLYDAGVLPPAFRSGASNAMSFRTFPRLFLESNLLTPTRISAPPRFLANVELIPWASHFYDRTGELIQHAYVGHLDSHINDQYTTLAGSLRFLHNVIRFPGCGVFDPEVSWLLRDPATGRLIGVILCSRVAATVAHITQLCVLPAWRGKHLGADLLTFASARLRDRGYTAITLTVTEANAPAVALYHRAAFQTRQRFDALVLARQRPYRIL